jgi:glyoxylase-like metal-dependent hydrolase (beta-lactamase superfamily II)
MACLVLLWLGTDGVLRASEAERAGRLVTEITVLRRASPPQSPGSLPERWLSGTNCDSEPDFQVHAYNENTFIIRQSKCTTFEAPFLYLLFGDDKALLMDTGANASTDVAGTVLGVIRRWLQKEGETSIPLIVAHTHAHSDHVAGDAQFQGKPWVSQVVSLQQQEVEQFWGFQSFPTDQPTLDLGNRVIDVLGTPGHQAASVTLYDRDTHLLLTGDIVYPGHLFVFSAADWSDFVDSIRRLVAFAREHPVEWVLGCHIEMSNTPKGSYAWGTSVHPDEHPLELDPSILPKILRAAEDMGANPQCKIFDEFVLHPVWLCGITWNG